MVVVVGLMKKGNAGGGGLGREGQRGDDRVACLHARSLAGLLQAKQCGTLEAEDVRRMAKSRWATFALARRDAPVGILPMPFP